MPKTRPFDAAEYLDSPEMIAEYLTEAFETDDEVLSRRLSVLSPVRRAWAPSPTAPASPGKIFTVRSAATRGPEFETIRKVLGALGVQFVTKPRVA